MKKIQLILMILICSLCVNVKAQGKHQSKTEEKKNYYITTFRGAQCRCTVSSIVFVENKNYRVSIFVPESYLPSKINCEKKSKGPDLSFNIIGDSLSLAEENPTMIFSDKFFVSGSTGGNLYTLISLDALDQLYSDSLMSDIEDKLNLYTLQLRLKILKKE